MEDEGWSLDGKPDSVAMDSLEDHRNSDYSENGGALLKVSYEQSDLEEVGQCEPSFVWERVALMKNV